MVAVRIRAEGQSRRPRVGLSFPSPHWGEGRVRGGDASNGDSGHQPTGMTRDENHEKLIRFVRVTRYNHFNKYDQ